MYNRIAGNGVMLYINSMDEKEEDQRHRPGGVIGIGSERLVLDNLDKREGDQLVARHQAADGRIRLGQHEGLIYVQVYRAQTMEEMQEVPQESDTVED